MQKRNQIISLLKELNQSYDDILAYISDSYDPNADPNNTSPDDAIYHINGLIFKICEKAKKQIEKYLTQSSI